MKALNYLESALNPAAYVLYWPLFLLPFGVVLSLALVAYSIGMKKYYWLAPLAFFITFIIYLFLGLFVEPISVYG